MKAIVRKTDALSGRIRIPGSKSHTIRALVFGLLADGSSRILQPLVAADTRAVADACRNLGASVDPDSDGWTVRGCAGRPEVRSALLDLANSGTGLAFLTAVASLSHSAVTLDGDSSLRTRPLAPLLDALRMLGVETSSARGDGKCPVTVRGPLVGGCAQVDGVSSQYVSALLIAAPYASRSTQIAVINPHEIPYIRMTLRWMEELGVHAEHSGMDRFFVPAGQRYLPFEREIPADWSSAAFPLAAAAVTRSEIVLDGPDCEDVQGDKAIVDYLRNMGACVENDRRSVSIRAGRLTGGSFDLNATPDALPAMAVLAACAEGQTVLGNVAQARIKETDRIRVLAEELGKMGADITELPDGLVIRGSRLRGAVVDGRGDHRVVMALAVAGLRAEGTTTVLTAEAAGVTYPGFFDDLRRLGADVRVEP